ncbi:MAG: hypothetical protein FJ135_15035 [Deltaproteobacteria bacterium]|nr:hypothetical protein [Deltaproteobacteria bacterium]
MVPLSEIDLPPGWEETATRILAAHGVVMVLGGPDSGKSTFCRYILALAQQTATRMALIDGDLGQSHLGPPATLGLNFYPPHGPDDFGLIPDTWYFIGQTSPPGKMLELVVGLRRLAVSARSRDYRRLIVNTSGFVSGPAAQRLKLAKIETLEPRLVIGLQRQGELEPLLRPLRALRGSEVLTLPVSHRAQAKLYGQRRLYRQERFAAYFAAAHPQALPLTRVSWLGFPFGQGKPWPLKQMVRLEELLEVPVLHAERTHRGALLLTGQRPAGELAQAARELGVEAISWVAWPYLEQRLVGLLNDDLLCLGLGLLLPSPWERREIILLTPLSSHLVSQVRFCRLGKIRLDPDGRELPFPGC